MRTIGIEEFTAEPSGGDVLQDEQAFSRRKIEMMSVAQGRCQSVETGEVEVFVAVVDHHEPVSRTRHVMDGHRWTPSRMATSSSWMMPLVATMLSLPSANGRLP